MKNKNSAIETTKRVLEARYQGATVAFCAGSFVRGDATEYSDIDLVVFFSTLDRAFRESFIFEGWPMEAFVHDPSRLRYFFEKVDLPSGFPSLPSMVAEGVPVPSACSLSKEMKQLANELLVKGPVPLTEMQDLNYRYLITDLIDDLRSPRGKDEGVATGIRLYETLSDYYFRSNGKWSAKGKHIPRKLKECDPLLAVNFAESFNQLFINNDATALIDLTGNILEPFGGFVFEGYKRIAPEEFRLQRSETSEIHSR